MNFKLKRISARLSSVTMFDHSKTDLSKKSDWVPGGLHWFLGNDGRLIDDSLDQHLDALIRSKGITLKQVQRYAESGKFGVVNTLIHHLNKFPPKGWWELVPVGSNSMSFIKAFRRGLNRAPSSLMNKHFDFIYDEFMKTSDNPGSAEAAKELSKYIPVKEFTGTGKYHSESGLLSDGWKKKTYVDGKETHSEDIEVAHVPAKKIVETYHIDLPNEVSEEMQKMIPDLAKKR